MVTSAEIRTIYCRLVQELRGHRADPRFAFRNSTSKFQCMADTCNEHEFDPYLYVLSKFDRMPQNWCLSKFGIPYPPPYIVAGNKDIENLYYSYVRRMKQYAETESADVETANDRDEHTWETVGRPYDENTLHMLVENGMLSRSFVEHLLSITDQAQ